MLPVQVAVRRYGREVRLDTGHAGPPPRRRRPRRTHRPRAHAPRTVDPRAAPTPSTPADTTRIPSWVALQYKHTLVKEVGSYMYKSRMQ